MQVNATFLAFLTIFWLNNAASEWSRVCQSVGWGLTLNETADFRYSRDSERPWLTKLGLLNNETILRPEGELLDLVSSKADNKDYQYEFALLRLKKPFSRQYYNLSLANGHIMCTLSISTNKSFGQKVFCDFDKARLKQVLGGTYDKNASKALKERTTTTSDTTFTQKGQQSPGMVVVLVLSSSSFSAIFSAFFVAVCIVRYYHSPAIKGVFRILLKCLQLPNAQSVKSRISSTDEIDQLISQLPVVIRQMSVIPSERLQLNNVIGSGNFGLVKCGILRHPDGRPTNVALKFLQNKFETNELLKEMELTLPLQHPNILTPCGLSLLEGCPTVIMPLMDGGDLLQFVRSMANDVTDLRIHEFSIQIAEGMQHLASNGIVHRDLAARNCLLSGNGVVKVADFGLSRKVSAAAGDIYELPNYVTKSHKPLPFRWMAPESLQHGFFSEKTDMWSFGVTFWELTTRGATPYSTVPTSQIIRHVCEEAQRLPKLQMIPDAFYKVMSMCWNDCPSSRPKFADLVAMLSQLLQNVDNFDQESNGYCSPNLDPEFI